MQPEHGISQSSTGITALVRRGLAGLFLSGLIFTFLGAILPAWGYHLSSDYSLVGTFFLAMNAGFIVATWLSRTVITKLGIRGTLILSTTLASVGFLGLIFAIPPAPPAWCHAILPVLGFAAGLLNIAVFELIAPAYTRSPDTTLSLGGIVFLCGSIVATVTTAGAIDGYSRWIPLALFSLVCLGFTFWFGRHAGLSLPAPVPVCQTSAKEFRRPAAVLMTLVFFFQFWNEWAIAGWLPLFLIQRLGISPWAALAFLTLYWLTLLVGRAIILTALPRSRSFRVLLISTVSALFGCMILALTNNKPGATAALLLMGGGYAAIYPLLLETAGKRFRAHHPGQFNGILALGLIGGLLSPWLVGSISHWGGMGLAMMIPLFGTIMVFLLLISLRIEAKLNPVE